MDLGFSDALPVDTESNADNRNKRTSSRISGALSDDNDPRRQALRLVIKDVLQDKTKRYHLPAYTDPFSRQTLSAEPENSLPDSTAPQGFAIDELIGYHRFQSDRITDRKYSIGATYGNNGERRIHGNRSLTENSRPVVQGYFLDPRVVHCGIITPAMIEEKLKLVLAGAAKDLAIPVDGEAAATELIKNNSSNHNGTYAATHHQKEIINMPKELSKELADAFPTYAAFRKSFGVEMKAARKSRKIEPGDLAKEMTAILAEVSQPVTRQQIEKWESGRGPLPNDQQLQAIVTVLIDNNKIFASEEEKEAARARLITAYDTSKAARQTAKLDDDSDELYLFANTLKEIRTTTKSGRKSIHEEDFATAVTGALLGGTPPLEVELLKKEKGYFVEGIEAGAIVPSKPMLLTIFKAFKHLGKELSDDEKKDLHEKYAAISEKSSRTERDTPSRAFPEYDQEKFREMKAELIGLLTHEGQLDMKGIEKLIPFNAQERVGRISRTLLDLKSKNHPARYGALSETVVTALVTYATDKFPQDEEKLQQIRGVINRMRALTGYNARTDLKPRTLTGETDRRVTGAAI